MAFLVRPSQRSSPSSDTILEESVHVKFHKWLKNDYDLVDTDKWQPLTVIRDTSVTASEQGVETEYMDVAIVKGVRVVLMEQIDSYSLYQNVLTVSQQYAKYEKLVDMSREHWMMQQMQIQQQCRMIERLERLCTSIE